MLVGVDEAVGVGRDPEDPASEQDWQREDALDLVAVSGGIED